MIDTHCHLIDPQFTSDFNEVLERAQRAGVTSIINAGYDVKTSTDAIAMGKQFNWLKPAIGIHPNEAAAELVNEMGSIETLLRRGSICAIGETGLDYYRDFSPRDAQKELFRKHIVLARKYHLPLLIHTRRSIDDAIATLKEENYHCGVFHCYSGTYEQAKIIIAMGYYLGFGGVLTFSKGLQEIFEKVPTDRILLETDAPFLAPEGHRGQRNEPSFIIETLTIAARILDVTPHHLEEIVDHNAKTLFSL